MDLIAGLNELIAQMEEDITPEDTAMVIIGPRDVRGYIRTIKTLIKSAVPKTTPRDDEGGASVSIGGSSQPQQPPPPSRPFKANRKPVDPWEEAQKREAIEKRLQEPQQETEDEDGFDERS